MKELTQRCSRNLRLVSLAMPESGNAASNQASQAPASPNTPKLAKRKSSSGEIPNTRGIYHQNYRTTGPAFDYSDASLVFQTPLILRYSWSYQLPGIARLISCQCDVRFFVATSIDHFTLKEIMGTHPQSGHGDLRSRSAGEIFESEFNNQHQ